MILSHHKQRKTSDPTKLTFGRQELHYTKHQTTLQKGIVLPRVHQGVEFTVTREAKPKTPFTQLVAHQLHS
jgi:hypothetical protein